MIASGSTKTHGVINPEQLAKLFEIKAQVALRYAELTQEHLHRAYVIESETWLEAARVVRDTEFVGWNESMFKVADGDASGGLV